MADEVKPITTPNEKPARQIEVGKEPAVTDQPVENKRDTSGDQTVTVRALRVFHKDGDMKGEMSSPGDEFEVDRGRAAQLRANGLIEYVNEDDDHAIHGQVDASRISERVAQQTAAAKIPPNSKGAPLRNPEVKLAELPADKGGKQA